MRWTAPTSISPPLPVTTALLAALAAAQLQCAAHPFGPPSADRQSAPGAAPEPVPARGPARPDLFTGAGNLDRATPAEALHLPPGFQASLLYSVPRESHGSWVSLAVDAQDRLLASPQHHAELYRVTLDGPGTAPGAPRVEPLGLGIGHAHGLLCVGPDLYVVVADAPDDARHANGVYRLRDRDGDDRYDEVTLLAAIKGGGEHGPHGLVPSPDGQWIYFVGSNYTQVPAPVTRFRAPRVGGNDSLLSPVGKPGADPPRFRPGGWVVRFRPDGSDWELVATGLRNAYDLAFHRDGDLFTYDSDMEWDLGTAWYRPPRILLVASGAEFGWRNGTLLWPDYFGDGLGSVLDTGPASPTGVLFGYATHFPGRYRDALYALDWTYGTIHAVHLRPSGSAYLAEREEFLSGAPLPVADAVVRKDGALYFVTGGRKVQSGLYRIAFTGDPARVPTAPAPPQTELDEAARLRELRHELEALHGPLPPGMTDAQAVARALPTLGHADRYLRHAARLVLEHRPLAAWRTPALALRDGHARATAVIALARHGKPADRAAALRALGGADPAKLGPDGRLDLLRAYSLVFLRLGKPTAAEARAAIAQLDPLLPSGEPRVDVELSRVLAYLEAPSVAARTIALMEAAAREDTAELARLAERNAFYGDAIKGLAAQSPHRQRMALAATLRELRAGWTPPLRRRYFQLIAESMTSSRGGNLYYAGWAMIRDQAAAHLPPAERRALAGLLDDGAGMDLAGLELPSPQGPGQEWTVRALMEPLGENPGLLRGRSFENGKKMFAAATCILCHRIGPEGGSAGPDLTGVGSRFSLSELLESIVNPSSVVSDQYAVSVVTLKDGEVRVGRIVQKDDEHLSLMPNMFKPQELEEIPMATVAGIEPSPMSQMPPGLVNALNQDELLDLLAYLIASGDPKHALFRP